MQTNHTAICPDKIKANDKAFQLFKQVVDSRLLRIEGKLSNVEVEKAVKKENSLMKEISLMV
jgi:hypothetical protein